MKRFTTDPVIRFFISVIGLVVILFVLKEFQFVFIPLAIAYFLFFVFQPVNKLLAKIKIPHVVYVLADLIILILIFWGISHVFISSVEKMGGELPQYTEKISSLIRTTAASWKVSDPSVLNFDLNSLFAKLDYTTVAGGVFSTTISFFSTSLLVLFFFIFISGGHDKIFEAIKERFVEKNIILSLHMEEEPEAEQEKEILRIKEERAEKIEQTFKDITGQAQKYIVTKFLINLFSGILFTIILFLFGIKYAIVWGALSFMCNFIPNIGSIFSVMLPVLMSIIQYDSIGYTLVILIVLIVVQNIIGNILEPKIFGYQLGINPMFILISLLMWGYTWGIIGMFMSVPLTAIIKIILSNANSKNLQFINKLMSN